MAYSVQQVKFEFLSYIKEFGARAEDWRVGTAVEARSALFERNGVDPGGGIWLWKPTLGKVAAQSVRRFFIERFRVRPAPFSEDDGAQVFLFKATDSPVLRDSEQGEQAHG